MSINCRNSTDCFDNKTRIQKQCYFVTEDKDVGVCDCALGSGWKGKACNEQSIPLYYNRIIYLLIVMAAILLVILTSRSLFLNVKVKLRNSNSFVDPNFIAIFLGFLASIPFLMAASIRLYSFFDPTFYELIVVESYLIPSFETVSMKNARFEFNLLLFSITAVEMLNLILLISLSHLVKSLSRFQGDRLLHISSMLIFTMRAFGVCLLAFYTTLIGTKSEADIGIIGSFVTIFLSVVFPIVSCQFVSTINSLGAEIQGDGVQETKRMVKVVAVSISTLMVLATVLVLLLQVFSYIGHTNVHYVGRLNPIILSRSVLVIDFCLISFIDAWYLNSITEGAILADFYPAYCDYFRWWDAGSRRIIPGNLSAMTA